MGALLLMHGLLHAWRSLVHLVSSSALAYKALCLLQGWLLPRSGSTLSEYSRTAGPLAPGWRFMDMHPRPHSMSFHAALACMFFFFCMHHLNVVLASSAVHVAAFAMPCLYMTMHCNKGFMQQTNCCTTIPSKLTLQLITELPY